MKRLEESVSALSVSLRNSAKACTPDIRDCCVTLQKRSDTQGVSANQTASSGSTKAHLEDIERRLQNLHLVTQNSTMLTAARIRDLDASKRQILALIPPGTKKSFQHSSDGRQANVIHCIALDVSTEASSVLGTMLRSNEKLCSLLEESSSKIPQSSINTTQDTFIFQDVLGRNHVLEYRWFQHWDIFLAMLKCIFKDLPGEKYIELNKYLIQDSHRGGITLDKERWSRTVFPQSTITMSIAISIRLADPLEVTTCPQCSKVGSTKCCPASTFIHW